MKNDWKYRIGKNNTGTVLCIFMLVLFGSITVWLYISKNGAFLFGMILSAVMLIISFVSIYNTLFHKILIGKNSIYYQTSPTNGKEYKYNEISKVWISSGKNLNGTESDYCNIRLNSNEEIRFSFFPDEAEGIEYLMERVEAFETLNRTNSTNDDNTVYKITGKFFGGARIVISCVILAISVFLEIALYQNKVLRFILPLGIITSAVVLIYNLIRYLCFNVRIESDGFYVRTGLSDGKYYKYTDIKKCKAVMKEYKHRNRGHGTQRMYYYFFVFTDADGNTRRFQFEKAISGYEIEVLSARIQKANAVK